MNNNPLIKYFDNNRKRFMFKWAHYFDIYHRYFAQFVGKKPTVLEIGVHYGGSLQMWKSYFGEGARVYGVDINSKCRGVEEEGIKVFIGKQGDRKFLRDTAAELGEIHILIDDGSHKGEDQIVTFEELCPIITAPGVYLVEDLQTNYLPLWEGGLCNPSTFIEYSKRLIDGINFRCISDKDRKKIFEGMDSRVADNFEIIYSISYYPNLFVLNKKEIIEFGSVSSGRKFWAKEKLDAEQAD